MDVFLARFSGVMRRRHLSRELTALFAHRAIVRTALSALTIFSAVFLFEVMNQSLLAVVFFYASMHTAAFLFTPISVRLLRRIGVRSMMLAAIPFLVANVGAFWFAAQYPNHVLYALVAAVIFGGIYKILYWVPYHVDFAHFLEKGLRGRQLATLENTANILMVSAPLIGGLIVAGLGFEILFLVGIVGISLSVLPLLQLSNSYESFSWGYIKTFQELFDHRNRSLLLAKAGDGAQGAAVIVLWPLFIFLLVDGEYVLLGAITALSLCAVILIRSMTGRLFDRWSRHRTIMLGSIASTAGWIIKLFVQAPIEIVMADTYHGAGRAVNRTSVDAMAYEQAADNGTYIDEYTALKEMALALGRMGMFAVVGATYWFLGIEAAFISMVILAAVSTLSTMLIARRIVLA